MGGININQKHNLTINSKSLSFYILASLVLLTLLSFIIISIRISFLNAIGNEGAGDTGTATLNSVSILQAGTGQSVTIKGETLNENDYGTDNTTRRTILNNNVVRYSADYNVTKTGQITFSITLPANNTIDEATIAESQYCLPNLSKLEPADITNDDGTITKSYTNNKATCVRNITNAGSTNWQITAYAWGANNAQIQPTLAISGQTQDQQPEAISVVGRGDYTLEIHPLANEAVSDGYDMTIYPAFSIYANVPDDTGTLGVAPLGNRVSVKLDTSNLPKEWSISLRSGDGYFRPYPDSSVDNDATSVIHSEFSVDKTEDDGSGSLVVYWHDSVTGGKSCPTMTSQGSSVAKNRCYYLVASFIVRVPTSSLTNVETQYSMSIDGPIEATMGDGEAADIATVRNSLTWTMWRKNYGNPRIWGGDVYEPNVGWVNMLNYAPVYVGQDLFLGNWIQLNTISDGSYANNLSYCTTWNPGQARMITEFNPQDASGRGIILSDYKAQYGIIGTDMSVLPSSSQQYCGKVGDENILGQQMFFDTLEEANQYAKDNNLAVNAMRLWSAETRSGLRDGQLGAFYITPTIRQVKSSPSNIEMNVSGTTNEWAVRGDGTSSDAPLQQNYTIISGLLSHTLTAIPSSTNPGKEDHITITTKTYNKDANSKITINLPSGLTPKEGSFTITTGYKHNEATNTNEPIKAVLVEGEGQDYTITTNGEGSEGSSREGGAGGGNVSYTITLDLDHIATTHNVPITGYDPLYPGESGVTNITFSNDTGLYEEVVTTNNNNTDDDINNDDLPIAADNDGNGISHIGTPIEFDVTVNEDTPSPSTLTINSTASGTGTDYASTTFKTTSDTIAIANPPKTFGYDLTASSNNIYAGDSLTYNYSISNTTDTDASNIQMLTVLPFNGDSRGTIGLMDMTKQDSSASSPVSDGSSTITNPYTISHLSLSLPSDGASGLDTSATKLYYTLDPKAHELEPNPEALATDSSITWQELELGEDGSAGGTVIDLSNQLGSIASNITAFKLTSSTLASNDQLELSLTLDNILANTPSSNSPTTIASDITYLSYVDASVNQANQQEEVTGTTKEATPKEATPKTILLRSGDVTTYSTGQTVSIHQNPATTNYLGELLALSIPKVEQDLQLTLELDEVLIGDASREGSATNPVNHLSLTTATMRGYTLIMQTNTENGALVAEGNEEGNTPRYIPSISTKPTTGTAGWSMAVTGSNNQSLTGTNWSTIPGINQTPLNLYASTAKGRDGRNLTITYGLGAASTITDTYKAEVVYTVVAEL